MSDSSLRHIVTRCQQGDDDAWDKLMNIVTPIIFSICRQSGLNSQECFDVFGQVSYKLVTHIHRISSPNKTVAYVATTTRRMVANFFRASKFVNYLDSDGMSLFPDSPSERPDQVLEMNRRIEALKTALLTLSDKEKELITALFLENSRPDYKAIAKRFGIPVSSIGPTRGRNLTKLRRILEKKTKRS
ncbi:MAG: sigma-70 family RNA polymerase sigma factor [candidate division Zixibacteria bacterium]|nr:sigma-70 family RNA polymerase sigma factor [candidate division Zixibacteria bacterium]